jgi:hypothetical protein
MVTAVSRFTRKPAPKFGTWMTHYARGGRTLCGKPVGQESGGWFTEPFGTEATCLSCRRIHRGVR